MPHYCNTAEKEVDLWFKGKRFKCERPGKTSLDGYDGTLMCPDYDDFCEFFDKRCPMDCYGHGICLEKVEGTNITYECFCLDGYDGADCGTCPSCLRETSLFILCADTTPGATVPTCYSDIIGIISLSILTVIVMAYSLSFS